MAPLRPENVVKDEAAFDVLIVAVTYNSGKIIGDFMHALPLALEGAPSTRVVLVDNDSRDDTATIVRSVAPWITLLETGQNLGYAGAINVAIHAFPPRRGVYVLNPDAVPSRGSVARLLEVVADNPRAGIAVPCIRNNQGERMPSLRRQPTVFRALGEAVLGGSRAGRFAPFGEVVTTQAAYHDMARADWATGAAMFISRAVLDEIGDWDERFFLYSEETDYALRARDAGFSLVYVPTAEVRHLGGELGASPGLWSLMALNRVRLFRKRNGLVTTALYWAASTCGELARAAAGRERSRAALRALLSEQGRRAARTGF